MVDKFHYQDASEHARNAIFLWYATSFIYSFIYKLFSWKWLVFYAISMFIASIVSIPTYGLKRLFVKGLVKKIIPEWVILIYWVIDIIYIPIVAIITINLFLK